MEIFGFFSKDFAINSHTHGVCIYTCVKLFLFYLNASDIMQHWLNIKIKGIFDSKWIFKKVFNPFHASGLFLYPEKILENQEFCDVSRDIERDQWSEIVSEENKLRIAFSLTCSLNTAWFYVCSFFSIVREWSKAVEKFDWYWQLHIFELLGYSPRDL